MVKKNCLKIVKNGFIFLGIFLFVGYILGSTKSFAASIDTINIEGKIVRNDSGYEGMNVSTGSPACIIAGSSNDTCDFQVKYYSASTNGTLFLTETFSDKEIGQYNGAFNLSLGSGTVTAGTYSSLNAVILAEDTVYLEIKFAPAGASSFTETFSRMPLQASAYAIRSKYSSGADSAFQFDTASSSSGYATPSAGMVYFDTTDSILKIYDGSSWSPIASGIGSGSSLWTDAGDYSYLTSLTDHLVLGSTYIEIGANNYATYLAGLASNSPFAFDMDGERLSISGDKAQSGLTVYSNYTSTGAWPLVVFKSEYSGFDNTVLEVTQDGTGNIASFKKGSAEVFAFENEKTFFIGQRDGVPTTYSDRLYNVGGTLYWSGSSICTSTTGCGSGSLWTDGGTYTYLTSSTDDLIIGGTTPATSAFFFDVSTGRLGIGTSTPTAALDIAGANSFISNSNGDITISADDTLVVKANDTQADNLMEWQNSTGTVLGLINQNGYATFGGSTGSSTAILSLGANTSAVSQINLASSSGINVSGPTNGDLWWNGINLYFYDGTESIDLLGNEVAAVQEVYGEVTNKGYLNLQHDQNTYAIMADGWVCVGGSSNEECTGGNWKSIVDSSTTIGHYASNVWDEADTKGVIHTTINASDLELTSPNSYGVYTSPAVSTPNAKSYGSVSWNEDLDTYGDVSVQTRTGPNVTEMSTDANTVGLWHMNETSGTTVADSSSSNNTGTAIGSSINMVDQLLGNASRNFDGSEDYISVPDSSSLQLATSLTIEVWFKAEGAPALPYRDPIVRKDTNTPSSPRYLYGLNIEATGQVSAEYYNGLQFLAVSNSSYVDGQWHYAAMTISGTTMLLYVDGTLNDSITISGTQGVPTGELDIGATPPHGGNISRENFFKGSIDEVRISNTARSASVIALDSIFWEQWTSPANNTAACSSPSCLTLTTENSSYYSNWTGTNATVAAGDVTRMVSSFEDDIQLTSSNLTKMISSTNGGYIETTVSPSNLTNYDYLTLWVRASQAGNIMTIGMGESSGNEQTENITIDVANEWQKVYWDLSDITTASRDAITKIRLTNLLEVSNTIHLGYIHGEKLLTNNMGSKITSTAGDYLQYRIIFTTTNTSYSPKLENISITYNTGYKTVIYDSNNIRLYNYTGETKYLKLNIATATANGSGGSGDGFTNGIIVSSVDDGNEAIAFTFNTTEAYTNSSSKLLSVMNNGTEKMYLDSQGNLYVAGTVTAGKGQSIQLINNSGTTVAERSLVTLDPTLDNSFTTTTIQNKTGAFGVVQGISIGGDYDEDGLCDNGDICTVSIDGVVNVNIDNPTTVENGNYVHSSTTAGKATTYGAHHNDGLIGVVTSTVNSSSGYVQMVFDAQNKVSAVLYTTNINLDIGFDKNAYRDMYTLLAKEYENLSLSERRGVVETNQSEAIMFDTFVDTLKVNSEDSTVGLDVDTQQAGLFGGLTIDSTTTDIVGNRYLGSATATLLTSEYYDRAQTGKQDQDSIPETLVDLGIDPNWYNGVSLVTTNNISTSCNGSLINVSGMYGVSSEHGYIDLTVTGTTVTGITANISSSDGTCSVTGASLTFNSDYSFTAGSCSGSNITINPIRSEYNNGDKFRIASWVVEPTTINDRGSMREFPERSVILASKDASNGYLTIIDADTQRVWMKFVQSATGEMFGTASNSTISSISMMNGEMSVGMNGTAATGMYSVQFNNDQAFKYSTSGKSISNKNISDRNIANTYSVVNASQVLINNIVNDVSSNVIPNQPTQEMTVSGWGYIQGTGNNLAAEIVNLPYKFDSLPNVVTSIAGWTMTNAPANLTECNVGGGTASPEAFNAHPTAIENSSFTVSEISNTSFSTNWYYCYTWTATGQVSPKQFTAVAEGNSTSGGTDILNRTDGVSVHLVSANGVATSNVWQNVVSITDNELYVASNDFVSNTSQINSYYGVHGLSSESSANVNRRAKYGVGADYGTPVVLGLALGTGQITSVSSTPNTSVIDEKSNTIYVSTSSGVSVIQENQGNGNITDGLVEATGSVKYYTKDYISEQMVGDVRGMWPLNYDNTSVDNEDISIKANALTAVNIDSNDAVSGVRGKAVDFNGINEYLYKADTDTLDIGTGSFSVSAWIKTGTIPTSWGEIIGKEASGSYSYNLGINNSGEVQFVLYQAGGGHYLDAVSTSVVTDNQWHYVTATWNPTGTVGSIYVDGNLQHSTSTTTGTFNNNSTGNFLIGAEYIPANFFTGLIDEPMVTATALTSAQIKSQYEDGLRALKGSHSVNDAYNQLNGTSNDIGDILVTPDSQYMYVGTEGGGISKIDLTSSTRVNTYTTSTDPTTSTNNIELLSGRNYLVFSGDIGSSGSLLGMDSETNDESGVYYSNMTTFSEVSNKAYLWLKGYTDLSDTSGSILVSVSNDGGANYATGILVRTSGTDVKEYEYRFDFTSSDNEYIVKIELARDSSKKSTVYITGWGLATMALVSANGNGLYSDEEDTIADGSYLEVVHGQNTYNVIANGWVFDTTLSKWVSISNDESTVEHTSLSDWYNENGTINTTINDSDISLDEGDVYGIYTSPVVSTAGSKSYGNISWSEDLNTYGDISVQTRSGNTDDPSADGLIWTKYDNSIPTLSNTTSTNGRIPLGVDGTGDDYFTYLPTVIKDGETYKMWYSGYDGPNYRIYYATSSDGLTWTKYDNSIPTPSNTTGTNGRIPLGVDGTGDDYYIYAPTVIKDGEIYKMWYTGYDGINYRIYYATSSDGLTWTKYDNSIPAASNTTGTNGRIPLGVDGTGDDYNIYASTVIKDGSLYKMWYSGYDGSSWRIYYATSSDGLTWTKYDNSIPAASNTTGTNGRIPLGVDGTGDDYHTYAPTVIKDGLLYKMWYSGSDGPNNRIYYATVSDNTGSWESWKPYTNGTDYTLLQSADTHTDWTGTNATVAEGDVVRNVAYYEDEDETTRENITKITSSTNGGYAESTIASTNLSGYNYISLWVRSSQIGATLGIGIGESVGSEQTENITIDVANEWQKVYWNISDISGTNRDGITKIRITNLSATSNNIYIDNIRAEKLFTDSEGDQIQSTPNEYLQYRVIFSTTNTSYTPVLQDILIDTQTGYEIRIEDANTVRLYNNSGKSQKLKLDVIIGNAATILQEGQTTIILAPSLAQTDYADNSNSIWINKIGNGGNLLKLQTDSTDMFVVNNIGDVEMAGDMAVKGGSISLGDEGSVRYNEATNTIEFSTDGGTSWMKLGSQTATNVLSAEYAGAVFSADGSDNIGNMTADNTGTGSNSMNYYEWNSSNTSLNDYDVRIRFAIPSNFESWSGGGITLNYSTESTSSSSNQVDFYVFEETSATIDGSSENNVSTTAGVWATTIIPGSTLDECDTANGICVLSIKLSSSNDNYVRIGDIEITYNRSL